MKLYIVGAMITCYSYADCIDHWFEKPRILGIFTDKTKAEAIEEMFERANITITEVETDIILNDQIEETCNYECGGRFDNCDNCKYSYNVLSGSGIDIV